MHGTPYKKSEKQNENEEDKPKLYIPGLNENNRILLEHELMDIRNDK